MRDDFSQNTKEILAKRIGYHCSNPKCRAHTSGPQEDPNKTINVGVAAHITAASSGGPRYNNKLTVIERKAAENGIWLCQKCAKLIDNDLTRYTAEKLCDWKKDAETRTAQDVEGSFQPNIDVTSQDENPIYEERDRPAFQILTGSLIRTATAFQPNWGIKQVPGDYVTNIKWRFRGPRFPMEWRATTGYALEHTNISGTFDLTADPVHDDLVDINEMAVEIRFHWRGRWLSEIHRWPITHSPLPTKDLWDVGREKLPPICIEGESGNTKIHELMVRDKYNAPDKYDLEGIHFKDQFYAYEGPFYLLPTGDAIPMPDGLLSEFRQRGFENRLCIPDKPDNDALAAGYKRVWLIDKFNQKRPLLSRKEKQQLYVRRISSC